MYESLSERERDFDLMEQQEEQQVSAGSIMCPVLSCMSTHLALVYWQQHGVYWRWRRSLWMVSRGDCRSWSCQQSHALLHV